MRMMHQVLAPGVQHGQEADLRTEMCRVGGDGAQRLRGCPEQDVVDRGLVLERDHGDLVRHGEHHMEVGHVEQFRVSLLQPLGACETLALRAIPVAARVVSHTLMAAVATTLDVTAKRRGAAAFDRAHGALPCSGQRRAMPVTKSLPEVAEHIRHFQPAVGHNGPVVQAGMRCGAVGGMTCRDSSGLAVAQTLLVAIIRYCAVVLRLRWPSSNWMVRRSVPDSSR
jgi:hypothetical protein